MIGAKKRDGVFYDTFDQQAQYLVDAAKLLAEMFARIEARGELSERIRELEHWGDKITHDTMARLHKTWITPLDSSDIRRLVSALDDVLDLTEAVSERVVLFEIQSAQEEAKTLSLILVRATEAVAKAIRLLPTIKRSQEILEFCKELNSLEREADRAYRHALAALYRSDNAEPSYAIEVLKWRDIYDNLEAATDRCEDVANILEGVVLEYG
jgi:predicted phosphate transport protein (TIGR00153 family)